MKRKLEATETVTAAKKVARSDSSFEHVKTVIPDIGKHEQKAVMET